tara:strand:- start:2025 stop:2702 length:678 start_codon:yes stop_codon:yes gene_type:complete
MKNKINVNTKLTAALKEKVDHTKPLVDTIRKNHNEFVGYWLVCYSAKSFNALDLFEPYLYNASLNFCPSELYNGFYTDSKSCYESTGKFDIPEKFSDGPMFLGLSHQETDNRNALFIPTTCLTGRNTGLYETLKKYTPKPEKSGGSQYDYFPNGYYSDSYGLSNRMRPEVTHAVVLYEGNQNGDCNITVRWIRDNLGFKLHEFICVGDIFEYLWEGLNVNPFSCY